MKRRSNEEEEWRCLKRTEDLLTKLQGYNGGFGHRVKAKRRVIF